MHPKLTVPDVDCAGSVKGQGHRGAGVQQPVSRRGTLFLRRPRAGLHSSDTHPPQVVKYCNSRGYLQCFWECGGNLAAPAVVRTHMFACSHRTGRCD